MNARQRRQFARARIAALSSVIVPGMTVERKAPGKAQATAAAVQSVTPQGVQVIRADRRSVFWKFGELVNRIRFTRTGKGHALRLSASLS
jgi:hypothetical protein